MINQTRRLLVIASVLMLTGIDAALAEGDKLPPLPPVTSSTSGEHLPGKIIWADLFSSNPDVSRNFYQQLFGWQWREIKPEPKGYGMFYLDDEPMAGLAHRDSPDGGDKYGRWIHYLSVADVPAAEQVILDRGGKVILSRVGAYPDRGDFAIAAAPDGALFGVMRTANGDPGDYAAAINEWIWWQVYSDNIDASAEFYVTLAGYQTFENEDTDSIADLFFTSEGYLRAAAAQLPKDTESKHVPTWLGIIRVEDVAASAAQAEALGGTLLYGPSPELMDDDLAVIADPTGATFAIMRWTYPEEEANP
jgi:predicted enzyme related to lactoylglutathione lyase